MSYEQYRARVRVDSVFKPLDGGNVEMIGGLIEQ